MNYYDIGIYNLLIEQEYPIRLIEINIKEGVKIKCVFENFET